MYRKLGVGGPRLGASHKKKDLIPSGVTLPRATTVSPTPRSAILSNYDCDNGSGAILIYKLTSGSSAEQGWARPAPRAYPRFKAPDSVPQGLWGTILGLGRTPDSKAAQGPSDPPVLWPGQKRAPLDLIREGPAHQGFSGNRW